MVGFVTLRIRRRGMKFHAEGAQYFDNCREAWIAGRVHVLHAFQKKSKSGIKTPQAEVELVETRLKAVLGRYRNERE